MDNVARNEILDLGRKAHDLTESLYRKDSSKRGDPTWPDKQRILLADMALHLLQTALREGDLPEADLKRNLFSILTISEQLMPGHELKKVADQLYIPQQA
ncbi:hypothetical protein [Pseudoduganella sp.]|uniref:hypothetical protein n=1 Tax=Pseudoduganella sp. TaxID=1880898 RepID=UPI0035B29B0F